MHAIGKYVETLSLAEKEIKGYESYFGENRPTIVGMCELLCDCCSALNKHNKTQKLYKKTIVITEKLYVSGKKQMKKLRINNG